MGKEEKIEVYFKCRVELIRIIHFKLGRKHKYCFEPAQGVNNKSSILSSHKQYRKKKNVKWESNKLHQGKNSPLKHDARIWKYNSFLFIHNSHLQTFETFLQWMGAFPWHPSLLV
jgi:hypothetical protein